MKKRVLAALIITAVLLPIILSCTSPVFDNPRDQGGTKFDQYAGITVNISEHPEGNTITSGDSYEFRCKAECDTFKVTRQWQKKMFNDTAWVNFGEDRESVLLENCQASDSGMQVRCVVTAGPDKRFSAVSDAALLSVKRKITTPVILTNLPSSKPYSVGDSAVLFFNVDGASLKYKWEYFDTSWSALSSETARCTLAVAVGISGKKIRCTAWNSAGSAVSNEMTIYVTEKKGAPQILTQPAVDTVVEGGEAVYSIESASPLAVSYSWTKNGTEIGTDKVLKLKNVQLSDNGSDIVCIVSNDAGSTQSETVKLIVQDRGKLPYVTKEPDDVRYGNGDTVWVELSAEQTESYQWQKRSGAEWKNIDGAVSSSMKLIGENITAKDSALYRCRLSSSEGERYSRVVTAVRIVKVVITPEPGDVTLFEGDQLKLAISAEHADSYQWQRKVNSQFENLVGKTESILTLTADNGLNGSIFRCTAANSSGGTAVSREIMVTVKPLTVPTVQSVSTESPTSAKIVWNAIAGSDGVNVYRSAAESGSFVKITENPVKESFFTDNGLVLGNTYFYQLEALYGERVSKRSETAKVTISSLPTLEITAQPKSDTIVYGEKALLFVTAKNAASYQWQRRGADSVWTNMPGSTNYNLSVGGIDSSETYQTHYQCVVTGTDGSQKTSEKAVLTVLSVRVSVAVSSSDSAVHHSKDVVLTADGRNAASYKWEMTSTPTQESSWKSQTFEKQLTFNPADGATNYIRYFRCKAYGANGDSVISKTLKVSVAIDPKPVIQSYERRFTLITGSEKFYKIETANTDTVIWERKLTASGSWVAIPSTEGTASGITGFTFKGRALVLKELTDSMYVRFKIKNKFDTVGVTSSDIKLISYAEPKFTMGPQIKPQSELMSNIRISFKSIGKTEVQELVDGSWKTVQYYTSVRGDTTTVGVNSNSQAGVRTFKLLSFIPGCSDTVYSANISTTVVNGERWMGNAFGDYFEVKAGMPLLSDANIINDSALIKEKSDTLISAEYTLPNVSTHHAALELYKTAAASIKSIKISADLSTPCTIQLYGSSGIIGSGTVSVSSQPQILSVQTAEFVTKIVLRTTVSNSSTSVRIKVKDLWLMYD